MRVEMAKKKRGDEDPKYQCGDMFKRKEVLDEGGRAKRENGPLELTKAERRPQHCGSAN